MLKLDRIAVYESERAHARSSVYECTRSFIEMCVIVVAHSIGYIFSLLLSAVLFRCVQSEICECVAYRNKVGWYNWSATVCVEYAYSMAVVLLLTRLFIIIGCNCDPFRLHGMLLKCVALCARLSHSNMRACSLKYVQYILLFVYMTRCVFVYITKVTISSRASKC